MTKAKQKPLAGSLRQLSEALGEDRSTLARLVKEVEIEPVGRSGAHPTYAVRDLVAALRATGDDGAPDPSKMSPFARAAHYRGERDRQRLAADAGELIPVDDVHDQYSAIMKIVARTFDTLPDLLERDVGLPAAAVARLERALDAARTELHRQLVAE